MKLAIYYRQPSGELVYHGIKNWPTPRAFIDACFPGQAAPPALLQRLPEGWPDTSAYWVGNWGYSAQPEKPKLRSVCLTDDEVEIAKGAGGGNMAKGIRLALRVLEAIDDVSPYL